MFNLKQKLTLNCSKLHRLLFLNDIVKIIKCLKSYFHSTDRINDQQLNGQTRYCYLLFYFKENFATFKNMRI